MTHTALEATTAMYQLRVRLPHAKIFVGNQYSIPAVEAVLPLAAPLVAQFNGVVQQVVGLFPENVYLVDIHTAFLGRHDLLLADRPGVSPLETHMTDTGHRVMAKAFADVIGQNR